MLFLEDESETGEDEGEDEEDYEYEDDDDDLGPPKDRKWVLGIFLFSTPMVVTKTWSIFAIRQDERNGIAKQKLKKR